MQILGSISLSDIPGRLPDPSSIMTTLGRRILQKKKMFAPEQMKVKALEEQGAPPTIARFNWVRDEGVDFRLHLRTDEFLGDSEGPGGHAAGAGEVDGPV